MKTETNSTFAQIIEDHLDLKRRNADLDQVMPLDRYQLEDPFENHPLFKTEEQARLEETMDGELQLEPELVLAWGGDDQETQEAAFDSLWGSRSRDFNWGD